MRSAIVAAALVAMTLPAGAECFTSKADYRSAHAKGHMSWHTVDGRLCYHTAGKRPRKAVVYALAAPPHPRMVQVPVPRARWVPHGEWLSLDQPDDVEKEVMATAIADRLRAPPWVYEQRWNFPP